MKSFKTKIKLLFAVLAMMTAAGMVITQDNVFAAQQRTKKVAKKKRQRKISKKPNYFKTTDEHHLNLVPRKEYRLKNLHQRVVQKHFITQNEIYALQLRGSTSIVRKADLSSTARFNNNEMKFMHEHHTQTWEDAGNGNWLVGVTPKHDPYSRFIWTTEIARVKFDNVQVRGRYLPRLTHLEAATDDPNYSAEKLQRVEATVSPDYRYLLISSLQYPRRKGNTQNVHFALYDLDKINGLLDEAEEKDDKTVSLAEVEPISAFHINNAYGPRKKGGKITEFQGMAIDSDKNIYVSCQNSPGYKNGKTVEKLPRELIKIPWGNSSSSEWTFAKLNHPDWKKHAVELEGIQLVGDKITVNVAYHRIRDYVTVKNCLFSVAKF